ncbi:MAG: sensor histidine kinase [Acidimicrobiia bacterium]
MRQPSWWWLAVSVLCAVLALATAVVAIMVQRAASTPIGEGEVFVADAENAGEVIGESGDLDQGVRHARNTLDIEAVSVVDEEGVTIATTSPSMEGEPIISPLLLFAISEGSFAAVAGPTEHAIVLDGVTEWPAGSILYQVVSPLDEDTSVLLSYDISRLLARRVRPAGIQSETIQLLALTAVFAVLGVIVFLGHTRASRRYREVVVESEMLREHSEKLRTANIELAEARNRAERALAMAEEKIRIRSEFVLMINHELRTPLTSVVTGAKLVRDGDDLSDAERHRLLDAVIADGARLQEMIDQILTVARLENQGLTYPLRRVSSTELVEALHGMRVEVNEDLRRHPDIEPVVLTDPNALSLLVASLVDNARDHGADRVTVTISYRSHLEPMAEVGEPPDHALYVTVSDDGPGIPPEFIPRVFEKFEKSSFSSGTGLGLYLARLMVEGLQGSLAVESSERGSSFQVAVPMIASVARVDVA